MNTRTVQKIKNNISYLFLYVIALRSNGHIIINTFFNKHYIIYTNDLWTIFKPKDGLEKDFTFSNLINYSKRNKQRLDYKKPNRAKIKLNDRV